MFGNFLFREDGKELVKKIDSLLPWEREELADYLFFESSLYNTNCGNRDEELFDDDIVDAVFDNDLQYEVLDKMDKYDVCSHISDNFDARSYIKTLIEYSDDEDVANAIAMLRDRIIEKVFTIVKKGHKETAEKIKELLSD